MATTTTRTSLTAVLLVALVAIALYPDSIRQLLLLRLPLHLTNSLSSRDSVATSTSDIDGASPAYDERAHELDYDALHAFVDANSLAALRWGTYRSGLYFGVRSRSQPFFVAAGLLWGSQHEDISQLRHECRQDDRLQKYGWVKHDGRHYGLQSIEDQFNRVLLQTHYVRLDPQTNRAGVDGWATRIDVSHLEPRDERLRKKRVDRTKLSLFFYLDLGCDDERLDSACRDKLANLLDVTIEPEARACGDGATCTRMTLESDGFVSDSSPETADAPLRFRAHVQLTAKASIGISDLRFTGLRDTNVLNVKQALEALAHRPSGASTDDPEIVLNNVIDDGATLVVVQAIVEADTATFAPGDVTLDVLLNEAVDNDVTRSPPVALDAFVTSKVNYRARVFDAQFAKTFRLDTKSVPSAQTDTDRTERTFNASDVAFAQAAFSNLVGGVGYFYGRSLVQTDPTNPSSVVETQATPLFTAVPSRSFFPRGFLWDEGFHALGIGAFDEALARDIVAHWLALMAPDGYIAREQVLGEAARRRVPAEFLVQHVEHANPPSLLLCLEKMLDRATSGSVSIVVGDGNSNSQRMAFLQLVFPFLERWYGWLKRTQRGAVTTADMATFRWRGRRADDGKLIANTLSSGLDDYPRASQPSDRELHVDLLSWMIKASDVMARLATILELDAVRVRSYERDGSRFRTALDAVHWHAERQAYFDVGDHSDDGHIERRVVVRCRNDATGATADTTATQQQLQQRNVACPATHPTFLFPLGDGNGQLKLQQVFVPGTTKLQHVEHIGYVSIFPLLLKVLPADSPKLPALLAQIADPQHLWSPFGLRSMSTSDVFYERENAPGDKPYWRGAIWLNANYLALDALHYYAQQPQNPYRDDCARVYAQLRANVIATVAREYARTGYLWEQYSGDVHGGAQYGRGQRCHPFSGWTALVVSIMAETY